MKTPHLCFILNCQNKVNREPDDFENLYCGYHKNYNNSDLADFLISD
jgi:hypothetical protein